MNNLLRSYKWISNMPGAYFKIGENSFLLYKLRGPTGEQITKDLDLSNKTCLITGASSGIGLEMAKCLSARNCQVLMACRNKYAASVVAKKACENNHLLQFYETNLAYLKSVKECSEAIINTHKKIDIVLLNAAVFGLPWTLTSDGLETTFQVNYLSQMYLLMNIEKILAPNVRVVWMSSESHRNVNWSTSQTMTPTEDQVSLPEDKYTSIKAYNISKLCGLLAMHYLGYKWLHTGKSVFCAHPGSFVKTRLCSNWWVYEALYSIMKPFSKTISQAASTPLFCATSPELDGLSAMYFKERRPCAESVLAHDSHLAFRMHHLTQDLLRQRDAVLEPTNADPTDAAPHPATDGSAKNSKPADVDTLVSNYST